MNGPASPGEPPEVEDLCVTVEGLDMTDRLTARELDLIHATCFELARGES